jgi:hypothetical protein
MMVTPKRKHDINQKRIRFECLLAKTSSDDDNGNDYFHHLLSLFQGDFDNYNQVLRDRIHALTPAEGGGHEHIHCTLVPCPSSTMIGKQRKKIQWILAAFYFNGNPRQIFRFRMYKLISPQYDSNSNDNIISNCSNCIDGEIVRMKLHTLSPLLEQQLRQYSDQPCTWWKETFYVWLNCASNQQGSDSVDMRSNEWKHFQIEGIPHLVSPLVGCDVLWDRRWERKKHTYLTVNEYDDIASPQPTKTSVPINNKKTNDYDGLHATMEAGPKGAIVDSISLIPGKRILIKDELSLWENEFWINDRGYDPDAIDYNGDNDEGNRKNGDDVGNMPFVYGNRRGVPYKLERVSCIISNKKNANEDFLFLERVVSKEELAWTLGDDYREQAVYEEKLRHVEEVLSQATKKKSRS